VSLMPPTDSMFLIPESADQPMHVGGLQVLELPEGAGKEYLGELYRKAVEVDELNPLFTKRAKRSLTSLGQWTWIEDKSIDLEHHMRHSALPAPGRVRELFALTSRLHGTLLDRHRPLWEANLIEGLEGNRFAVYTKIHHAMMDGVSGMRLLQRSLSTDPDDRDTPMPWAARPERRESGGRGGLPGLSTLLGLPAAAFTTATDVVGLGPAVLRIAASALREQATALPLQAPRSMFNVGITGSRRFAGDAWELDRIKRVAKAADGTVNDVVLAMCSSALRRYLLDLDALPSSPLIAMTPVSLRTGGDDEGGGNATGTILCNLATDVADPARRIAAIHNSMQEAKGALSGLSQLQVTALSAVIMAPLLLSTFGTAPPMAPPPFNLVISNVPGSPEPLYWNGARLQGMYPLSIPVHGQALNITVTSYAGEVQFGLTGDRRSVPRLQRLLTHLDEALTELESVML
jgi:diacylglycerol O-acyltransferase / wax synthase